MTYLLGEVKRMVIPVEGTKKGGRPPDAGYSLPGEIYVRRSYRKKDKSPAP